MESQVTTPFEYHRPDSVEAALALLGRAAPPTRPLAGGTRLVPGGESTSAVVDLSALPLSGVERRGVAWRIGATTTLDSVVAAADLPAGLRRAAERHAPRNVRQRATVGGVVASRNSGPLYAALLALDARVAIEPGGVLVPLELYLQGYDRPGHLVVAVEFPAARDCALAEVARTPADAPILVVAVGCERTAAGVRSFIAAAAGADQPIFLLSGAAQLLDGAPESDFAALAAVTPDLPWRDDTRGSRAYRAAMAPVLLQRAAAQLLASEVNHAG
jgi:carbon-monoxide dehydrogenase medium subunit